MFYIILVIILLCYIYIRESFWAYDFYSDECRENIKTDILTNQVLKKYDTKEKCENIHDQCSKYKTLDTCIGNVPKKCGWIRGKCVKGYEFGPHNIMKYKIPYPRWSPNGIDPNSYFY